MKRSKIKGYKITILIEEIGGLYYASAPGIGSIYIEEKSVEKAIELAKDAVISILDARRAMEREIIEGNEYLEVIYNDFEETTIYCQSDFFIQRRKTSRIQKRNVGVRR